MSKFLILATGGIAAGFVNGLLGTGGGIVLVFVLGMLMRDGAEKDVFVLTLSVTLVLSAVSAAVYVFKGGVDAGKSLVYGIGAIPGGIVGALLLDRLKADTLKKIFGGLLVFAGLNMAGVF